MKPRIEVVERTLPNEQKSTSLRCLDCGANKIRRDLASWGFQWGRDEGPRWGVPTACRECFMEHYVRVKRVVGETHTVWRFEMMTWADQMGAMVAVAARRGITDPADLHDVYHEINAEVWGLEPIRVTR